MFSVTPHSFIHQYNLDYFYPTSSAASFCVMILWKHFKWCEVVLLFFFFHYEIYFILFSDNCILPQFFLHSLLSVQALPPFLFRKSRLQETSTYHSQTSYKKSRHKSSYQGWMRHSSEEENSHRSRQRSQRHLPFSLVGVQQKNQATQLLLPVYKNNEFESTEDINSKCYWFSSRIYL